MASVWVNVALYGEYMDEWVWLSMVSAWMGVALYGECMGGCGSLW